MFTGIVEELGKIHSITSGNIVVKSNIVVSDAKKGDSIAVNGVCLTVTENFNDSFSADISPETCNVTALKYLKAGDSVNLERAIPVNGRFGGHIVTGHIDGIGKITKILKNRNFYDLEIELNSAEMNNIVKKGSIAVNGISLTVADILDKKVDIAVIPHTYENTCLKYLKAGDFVNIETDILAKYVEKFLSTGDNRAGIDIEFLQKNGF